MGKASSTTGTIEENATTRVPAGDALFLQTFGQTKSELIPQAQRITSTTQLDNGTLNGGTYYYEQSGNFITNGFCRKGILILKATEVRVTANNFQCPNGSTGFQGLVYIIGNFDHRGNSLFTGAVVVEGNAIIEETSITGSGQNRPLVENIRYNFDALTTAAQYLPRTIRAVASTWRQQ